MDTKQLFNPLFFKEMRHFGNFFRAFRSTFYSFSFLEWEALVRETTCKFTQFWLCEKTNITQPMRGRVGDSTDLVKWCLPQLHIKMQQMDISEIEPGISIQLENRGKKENEGHGEENEEQGIEKPAQGQNKRINETIMRRKKQRRKLYDDNVKEFPSDGYFKPAQRWDEETLHLHIAKSCPIPYVHVEENVKVLKQLDDLKLASNFTRSVL
ncbi:hypothetical protein RchiOBHm_Chr6g0266161 [Rosa chinensis]|uniref:Uncharacterized protein n=1 Tax=Rosa chinensis TaxID=74649 RepID=A0A2P6PPM9_ROSCH|nr:uncharacterized protein LOC112169391 [Rosa chinensis]XP_024162182.1 uncharacterized protein LOC112169391 [Rosa chinensis]XP_040365670.1 uncharacterized protein LOC112169391 [Rosa chinensis]XP_040365671.1 uncharacterized protein LOC112169391 [Rosa chinensis]PRQ23871.1 hypothetical protein RchiOBHm_Chr6g0266161 [Rosa chinensis]